MGRNTKKVAMTRGLGTRYGATVRKRYIKVLKEAKQTYKCPKCGALVITYHHAEQYTLKSVGILAFRHCKECFHRYTVVHVSAKVWGKTRWDLAST